MNKAMVSGVVAALAAGTSAAQSAAVSDQASFQASLFSFSFEDFSGVPDQDVSTAPGTYQFGQLSVSFANPSTFAGDLEISGEALDIFLDTGNIDSVTIDFGQNIQAFGVDITSPVSGGGFQVDFSSGQSVLVDALIPGIDTGGGTSYVTLDAGGASFNSVTLVATGVEFASYDNFTFGSFIPAPSSAALLAAAGLLARRRR